MLKLFFLSEYRFNEEEWNRVVKLFEAGHNKFKFDGNEDIIFKSQDQEEIEKYLGTTMDSAEILKEYISYFDGGEYLQVTSDIQIAKSECIQITQENFERYEDRIWESEGFKEEINLIIREQMYKVFLKYIEGGFERIDNGNFKWN